MRGSVQAFPPWRKPSYFNILTESSRCLLQIRVRCYQNSTFLCPVNFSCVYFMTGASFGEAVFEKDVSFTRSRFGRVKDCKRGIESHAHFVLATFKEFAWFGGCRFRNGAFFSNATFLRETSFLKASFCGQVSFSTTKCHDVMRFDYPKRSIRLFWKKQCPFIHYRITTTPFAIVSEGRTAYRRAKQTNQEYADYVNTGKFHYAELCAIEAGMKRPRRWGWFLVGRCIFGYGERWWHTLVMGAVLIFLCSLLYCVAGNIDGGGAVLSPSDQAISLEMPCHRQTSIPVPDDVPITNFWTSLYFSVVTFTTLGYGDMQPTGWMRGVAGFEALCGAGLMAAFVVVLSRKFVR